MENEVESCEERQTGGLLSAEPVELPVWPESLSNAYVARATTAAIATEEAPNNRRRNWRSRASLIRSSSSSWEGGLGGAIIW